MPIDGDINLRYDAGSMPGWKKSSANRDARAEKVRQSGKRERTADDDGYF